MSRSSSRALSASDYSSEDESESKGLESGLTAHDVLVQLGHPLWSRRHTCGTAFCTTLGVVCALFLVLGIIYPEEPAAYLGEGLTTPFPAAGADGNFDTMFELLGCYPLSEGDAYSAAAPFRDTTCVQRTPNGTHCRSGLPFYRFHIGSEAVVGGETVSWRMCAAFCSLKGFDVSGVVSSAECRCGASETNTEAWGGATPPPTLTWQPATNKVADDATDCMIIAHRFIGKPHKGQSFDKTSEDTAYIRSILLGRDVSIVEDSADAQPHEGDARFTLNATGSAAVNTQQKWVPIQGLDGLLRLDSTNASLPTCYPNRCASGWPWPVWSFFVDMGIPIAVSDSVSETTRDVFREAVEEVIGVSCLKFTQVSVYYNATYKIRVRGDLDGCFTNIVGFPVNAGQDVEINLGWCNSKQERGNMVHELLHALGMGHEQVRPDRNQYVTVNWATLPSASNRAQYEENPNGYTGGEMGPAPYDYDSIMHYPADPSMHTLPEVDGRGAHDAQIGQRQRMSPQDVIQLRSMYQCDAQQTLPCVDMDEGFGNLVQYADGTHATCAVAKTLCHDPTMGQTARYFCQKTCNVCPGNPSDYSESIAEPAVGCTDSNENLCKAYEEYCPGRVSGYEQYMSTHCKKTCWVEAACGPPTTPPPTPVETTTPNQGQTLQLHFSLKLNGYNLQDNADKQAFRQSLAKRMGPLFKTAANVTAFEARCEANDPHCEEGTVSVAMRCGCPEYGEPCSIGCAELQEKLDEASPTYVSKKLAKAGFAGVQVNQVFVQDAMGNVRQVFGHPAAKYVASAMGLLSLIAVSCACHRLHWLRKAHRGPPVGKDDYVQMGEDDDSGI